MAEKELTWTTWEELLLGCAVKRHGLENWDSVAMELRSRSSLPLLLTAQVCKNKFQDLKRRFMDRADHQNDSGDTIPWLEELRKLRVAELKQEVHRYDISIQSLQLKVKRLQEERERSLKETEKDDEEKPDLAESLEVETSEKPDQAVNDGSNRENRSFNESNSTANRPVGEDDRRMEQETAAVKPDPVRKLAREDSCNDSSDTTAKHAAVKPSWETKGGHPSELRDSGSESRERAVESSEAQSSASLTKKRRRFEEVTGRSNGRDGSPATIKLEEVKSGPLIAFLDIIRSHKHGSVFERRLESQKTKEYKNTIRHHVDLETIRSRVNEGSYSSTTKFYRDLLLLFTNAIVFFPRSSPQSAAAYALRDLVMVKTRNKSPRPDSSPELAPPKPDPERLDPLVANRKFSAPIIVCRRRSSLSAKTSNGNAKSAENQNDDVPTFNVKEEEKQTAVKTKEKRSLRGNSKGLANTTPSSNKGGEVSSADFKKKADQKAVKKQGAADFLKRIKQNSPLKPSKGLKNRTGDASGGKRDHENSPVSTRQGSGGRKPVKEKKMKKRSNPSKRVVGRQASKMTTRKRGGGAEVNSKQPRKRPRR
ncbi:hypothetical protein NMG60_11029380 [Bertholletia excelsa]